VLARGAVDTVRLSGTVIGYYAVSPTDWAPPDHGQFLAGCAAVKPHPPVFCNRAETPADLLLIRRLLLLLVRQQAERFHGAGQAIAASAS